MVVVEDKLDLVEEKSNLGDDPRMLQATSKPPSKKPSLRPTTRKPTTSKPTPNPSTNSPTKAPTNAPTINSTKAPTTTPTTAPTTFPSSAPSQIPLPFDGIEHADFVFAGKIDFNWDFPSYEGEIPDLETIVYHVFSSVGRYDFSCALENATASELIHKFEDPGDNITTQYHRDEEMQ